MQTLLLKVIALLLLCHRGAALQSSAFLAGVVSRSLLDFGTGFETSSPSDVKLVDVNEASCDLSLKAHSDRILSEVKDTALLATKILSDDDKIHTFFEQLQNYRKAMESRGCNPTSVRFSVHVSFEQNKKIPATIYFTVDLPPQSQLPIFYGEFDRTCRVEARGYTKRLVLKHIDVFEAEEIVSSEDSFDNTAMVLNYGAQGILLDVKSESVVDMYTLLSCENLNELGPQYMPLREGVKVGHIREFLASAELAIPNNRARSFMVIGFHPSDF